MSGVGSGTRIVVPSTVTFNASGDEYQYTLNVSHAFEAPVGSTFDRVNVGRVRLIAEVHRTVAQRDERVRYLVGLGRTGSTGPENDTACQWYVVGFIELNLLASYCECCNDQ